MSVDARMRKFEEILHAVELTLAERVRYFSSLQGIAEASVRSPLYESIHDRYVRIFERFFKEVGRIRLPEFAKLVYEASWRHVKIIPHASAISRAFFGALSSFGMLPSRRYAKIEELLRTEARFKDTPQLAVLYAYYVISSEKSMSAEKFINRLKKRRRPHIFSLARLLGVPYYFENADKIVAAAKRQLGDYTLPVLLYLARYGDDIRPLLGERDLLPRKFPVWPHRVPLSEVVSRLEESGVRVARSFEQHAKVLTSFTESCYSPTSALGRAVDWGKRIIEGPFLIVYLEDGESGKVLARTVVGFFRDPQNGRIYYGLSGLRARGDFYVSERMKTDLARRISDVLLDLGISRVTEAPRHVYFYPLSGPWEHTRTVAFDEHPDVLMDVPPARKELSRRVLRDDR